MAVFILLAGACTASVGPISGDTEAAAEPEPAAQAEATAVASTATPTATPAAGACGPDGIPDSQAVEWEVPGVALGQPEIDTLVASEPGTTFNVFDPLVALDASDPSTMFVLGPAWPAEVARVEPTETAGAGCMLTLGLTARGLELFNDVAQECFDRADRCPFGQLAIVVDGQVIVAPIVQSPVFDQPSLAITGPNGYSFDEAPALVQAIANGAQFRPVLAVIDA